MGALFDRYIRLTEGLIYEHDAYGRRPGCDPDLIAHGLEPITELERRGMDRLTVLDAELLTHKLTTIIEEARDVYMALSISEASAGALAKMPRIRLKARIACQVVALNSGSTARSPGASWSE